MTTDQTQLPSNKFNDNNRALPRLVRQYIAPGHVFIQAYRTLRKGEQAAIRRENPLLQEPFWRCANQAVACANTCGVVNKYAIDIMVKTLAQMSVLLNLKDTRFDDACGNDLGRLLRDDKLTDRRIEAVLTEKNADFLLTSLEATLQIGTQKIDFGVLLGDLIQFNEYPSDARERWARSLYSNWTRTS